MPELFPYRPIRPVLEGLSWATNVIPAYDGGESRVSLRDVPRQEFEWTVPIYITDRQFLALMRGAQTGEFYIPVWQDSVLTTAITTTGTGSLTVDVSTGDWRDRLILWSSADYCEILDIASIAGSTITLDGTVSQDYPVGATIAPVRIARMTAASSQEADDYALWRISWNVMDTEAIDEYDQSTQYNRLDVFMDPILLSGDYVPRTLVSPLELYDHTTGIITPEVPHASSRWQTQVRLYYSTRAEAWQYKRWLHKIKGRYLRFWVPTRKKEIRVVDTFTSTDDEIDVERMDWGLAEDTAYDDYVMFERFGSASPIMCRITGSSVAGNTETLKLDRAIGINGGSTTFRSVTWLHCYRSAADRIELSWDEPGRLNAQLMLQEAEQEGDFIAFILLYTTNVNGNLHQYDWPTELYTEIADGELKIQDEYEVSLNADAFDWLPDDRYFTRQVWINLGSFSQYYDTGRVAYGNGYWIHVEPVLEDPLNPGLSRSDFYYMEEPNMNSGSIVIGLYNPDPESAHKDDIYDWRGIVHDGQKFIAFGPSNKIIYNALDPKDKDDWILHDIATDTDWLDAVYNGSDLIVAVGAKTMYSTDGLNWTVVDPPVGGGWSSIAHSNGLYVAVGSCILLSHDPTDSWTCVANPAWAGSPNGVAFGNGKIVVSHNLDPGLFYCDLDDGDDPFNPDDWHEANVPKLFSGGSPYGKIGDVAYASVSGSGAFLTTQTNSQANKSWKNLYSFNGKDWYEIWTYTYSDPSYMSVSDHWWTQFFHLSGNDEGRFVGVGHWWYDDYHAKAFTFVQLK